MVHYIYVFFPAYKAAKIFKAEIKHDMFMRFLDRLHDDGCLVKKSSPESFKVSNGKVVDNKNYESIYLKPF